MTTETIFVYVGELLQFNDLSELSYKWRTITGHDNEMLVTSGKTVNTVVAADEMM